MRRNLLAVLRFVLSLGLAGLLLYLAVKDLTWAEIGGAISKTHLGLYGLGLLAMLLAHVARAARWQILLATAGHKTSLKDAFAALMVAYMTNYGLPRVGEVLRCTLLYRKQKTPVAVSMGTVVTERLSDVLGLAAFLGVFIVLEYERLVQLLSNRDGSGAASAGSGLLLLAGIGVLGLLAYLGLRERLRAWALFRKIDDFMLRIWRTVLSIRRLKQAWLFVFYTVLVWVLYWLTTYLVFEAFPGAGGLGLYFALFATLLGGIGMAVPVPGGIGSYHGAIVLSFQAFGLSKAVGAPAAVLLHGAGMFVNVPLGLLGYLYFMQSPKQAPAPAEQTD